MLQRIKISNLNDPNFQLCWDLYVDAFPLEERRGIDYHLEALKVESFNFEAIFDHSKFIGIIGWWQFETLRFIEHLATMPSVRGEGYGEKILHEFASEQPSPIILEVEHPTCELSRRRIGFYERNGFSLNSYEYSHPPYHAEQKEFVKLMLMSYPRAISSQEADDFKCECYSKVHFRRNNV